MKKLLIAVLLFVGLQNYGQDKVSTSQEEYNYLTIGYPESIEKGLSLKAGYKLEKVNEETFVMCNIVLYAFIETSSNNTKAYLIERKNTDKPKKTRYYCLAINNKDLIRQYDIASSNEPIEHEYMIGLSKLLVSSLIKK